MHVRVRLRPADVKFEAGKTDANFIHSCLRSGPTRTSRRTGATPRVCVCGGGVIGGFLFLEQHPVKVPPARLQMSFEVRLWRLADIQE